MKKFINLFIYNILMLGLIVFCIFNPEYSRAIKTYLYITLPLSIGGCMYLMNHLDELSKGCKERYKSSEYTIMDRIFDILFIIILAWAEYKLIFVLYILTALCNIALRSKFIEQEEKENEKQL